MKILAIRWKNFTSYGNKWYEIKFTDDNSFNLLVGENGSGKCVFPDTQINISFKNKGLEDRFKLFLENKPL